MAYPGDRRWVAGGAGRLALVAAVMPLDREIVHVWLAIIAALAVVWGAIIAGAWWLAG
jgi:hypothetical protein